MVTSVADVETNECLENNGGCWQDKIANLTACKVWIKTFLIEFLYLIMIRLTLHIMVCSGYISREGLWMSLGWWCAIQRRWLQPLWRWDFIIDHYICSDLAFILKLMFKMWSYGLNIFLCHASWYGPIWARWHDRIHVVNFTLWEKLGLLLSVAYVWVWTPSLIIIVFAYIR